ncbi:MAG: transporter [Comamonas sp.]|nr:transporter [Comamonas sp.]
MNVGRCAGKLGIRCCFCRGATALANRFAWITDKKYGMEALIPVIRTSLTINAAGVSDSQTGGGDIYLGPLILSWHGPQWDTALGAGFWLDTGSTSHPASAGKGYKGTMLTAGGTYFFDGKKTLSFSALSRYEFNGKDDFGMRPGQQLSVEWGLGKSFSGYNLGLVGYSQWQTSRDKGTGASDNKHQVHALGAEFTYPIPSAGVFLKAAAYKEFKAKGGTGPQPKGSLVRFTLVKAF